MPVDQTDACRHIADFSADQPAAAFFNRCIAEMAEADRGILEIEFSATDRDGALVTLVFELKIIDVKQRDADDAS